MNRQRTRTWIDPPTLALPHAGGALALAGGYYGEGIFDRVRGAYSRGKEAARKVATATNVAGRVFDSPYVREARGLLDPGHQPFAGERHMPLVLESGLIGQARYAGPGTQVIKRLRRGDKGRTATDRAAKLHDIQYSLARTADDAVRADKRMIKTLRRLEREGADSKINTRTARRLLQAKRLAEDVGLMKRGTFAERGDPSERYTRGEIALMETEAHKLKQAGFGTAPEKPMLPGERLKMKLMMEQAAKYSPPGSSPTPSGSGGALKLAGSGIVEALLPVLGALLAGQGRPKEIKRIHKAAQKGGFLPLIPMALSLLAGQAGSGAPQKGGLSPLLVAAAMPLLANMLSGKGALKLAGGSLITDVAGLAIPLLGSFLGQGGGALKLAGGRLDKFIMSKIVPGAMKALGLTPKDVPVSIVNRLIAQLSGKLAGKKKNEMVKAVSDALTRVLGGLSLRKEAKKILSAAEKPLADIMLGTGALCDMMCASKGAHAAARKEIAGAINSAMKGSQQGGSFFSKFGSALKSGVREATHVVKELAPVLAPIALAELERRRST